MADPKASRDAPPAAFAETGPRRELDGTAWRIVAGIALAFSAYQLVIAAFAPLSSLVTRSIHVGFLLLLALLTHPVSRRADRRRIAWYDAVLACIAFALAFYHWIFEADIIQRGEPILADLVVGTTIVVLVFDAARRVLGPALPIVCATFLAYGLFGQYLPSLIAHRGFGFDQVIGQLYLGTEGIYGIPTLVSATYIFLFILFGSFLEHAGMIGLFNSIALGFVGHARGGPAKVAVISSGMMGTISGSGIANVLTVGQFTIPLMKRFGYSSVFAGAVEATSSMGGQIMPPVMGAVAFIMAETLNVPYVTVVKAAVIPAVLYYLTAFWMVHLEAGRAGLLGLPKSECPNPWDAIRRKWYLMLPLAVLVIMLFDGFTPMFAGLVGLSLTAILILGVAATAAMGAKPFRYAFWIALGVGLAAYLKLGFDTYGVTPILVLIGALIAVSFVIRGGRETLAVMRRSLIDGATQAIPVGLACAIVGVIIGVLTLTGAASNFAEFVLEVGSKSLFLSLLLTMAVCLVLGMGIPTIPNYIITSAIAAPALLKLGVPLIVSHMFVFYFGIMADLTPPVALAAFAAASIAKASPMRIGWKATHIAIAGFVIPYMAVYDPALMLQGDSIVNTVYVVMKAVIAIGLWGAAAVGYLWSPLAWYERLVAMAAAFLLVVAIPWTDQAGFVLGALFAAWHGARSRSLWRARKAGGKTS